MSRRTLIFVGTQVPDADLMGLVERTLDGRFRYEAGSDPYLRVDHVAVYVGGHGFDDDDDIASPKGPEIPLHSEFPVMIETRQAVADDIFAALRAAHRWPAVYVDDMQKVLDQYNPDNPAN
jgi:hypothetical protein